MVLKLSRDFLDELVQGDCYICQNIQILPDELIKESTDLSVLFENKNIVSVNDDVGKVQEVIIPQSIFIEMFLECYEYIYKNEEAKSRNLEDMKIATLVILFVTPLDYTALNENWKILESLKFNKQIIQESFIVLASYLTSDYAKTNKSSLLWTFFKKLYVKLVENLINDIVNIDTIDSFDSVQILKVSDNKLISSYQLLNIYCIFTCLRSVKVHTRNYYACNTLRFLLSNINDYKLRIHYLDLIYQWILIHSCDDLSLWDVILDVYVDFKYGTLNGYRDEFKRFSGENGSIFKDKSFNEDIFNNYIKSFYIDLKTWCFGIGSSCYSGLLTLVKLNQNFQIDDKLIDNMNLKLEIFENENQFIVNIEDKSLQNMDKQSIDLNKNLLLKENFQQMLNIKRVLRTINNVN